MGRIPASAAMAEERRERPLGTDEIATPPLSLRLAMTNEREIASYLPMTSNVRCHFRYPAAGAA